MKLVIDTNKIIAALIKDSFSRRIILSKSFEFITPDHTLNEIYKYKKEVMKKANIDDKEFEFLINLIFRYIIVIPKEVHYNYLKKAKDLIKDIDDIPFIALALANRCGIWSDDKHFLKQKRIKIFKTKDLIKLI